MDPLVAFTSEQVLRVTGLSEHQLRYWDRTGFFSPSYTGNSRRGPYNPIYLFRDVVGLRALAILRNQHGIPLQELRKVGRWLSEHYETPWTTLRFFVIGHHVYFEDPQTRVRLRPGSPAQAVLPIELQTIENEARVQALRLRDRLPNQIGKITRHRHIVRNAWVLDGTRVPTGAVWSFHRAGHDLATILEAYPSLTPLDVQRAIEFEHSRRQRQRVS